LVSCYLSRPNTTVIATIRDSANSTLTIPLTALTAGASRKLILIDLESTGDSDYPSATKGLEAKLGITHVDVVIANAGVNTDFLPVASTPIDTIKSYTDRN